jgi:hypothetical protein
MSCHSLPMWQYFTKKEWETFEGLIIKKLNYRDKLIAISPEILTDYQFKKINELEQEINAMYAMKTMIFQLHNFYLESSISITSGYLSLWTVNEEKKQRIYKLEKEIVLKDRLIAVLFSKRDAISKNLVNHE